MTKASFVWGLSILFDYDSISLADKIYADLNDNLGFVSLEGKLFIGYKL